MESNNICRFTNVRSSDLACTSFVYEETNAQSKSTFTEAYIIGFVVRDSGSLNVGDRVYDIDKGNAFFVQKGSRFCIKSDGELAYFYISFCGRRAEELVDRFGLSEIDCIFELCDNYERLTDFAFDCLHRSTESNTDLLGEAGLLYLLAHLDSRKSVSNNLLSKMIALTNEYFTDSAFSLRALSESLRYDAKYLSFCFKKNKGICYSQYLRDLRIRHSIFLMEQGIWGVKNVAILSGFSDALYFSKIFKKETGATPKEYIKGLQEHNEMGEEKKKD